MTFELPVYEESPRESSRPWWEGFDIARVLLHGPTGGGLHQRSLHGSCLLL